jgi:hypothetical protein
MGLVGVRVWEWVWGVLPEVVGEGGAEGFEVGC